MPRINSDNLFGYTRFIVDPSAAQGSFTTIQSAINAAAAVGGFQIVAIKSGTYVENLTLAMDVQLYGVSVDGRIPTILVVGNHTFTGDGSASFGSSGILLKNIDFQAPAGNLFTITNNGPNGVILLIKDCSLITAAGAGIILSTAGGGTRVICNLSKCNARFQTTGVVCGDSCTIQLEETVLSAQSLAGVVLLGNSSQAILRSSSNISGETDGIIFNNAASNASIENSSVYCNLGPALNMSVGSASADLFHSTFNANGPFWASGPGPGPACQIQYADIILLGATAIDTNININVRDWQPYCTTGTSITAIRGTSAFDDTIFSAVNGFISLLNGQTGILWTDVSATGNVSSNTGSFTTNAIDLTLPIAPTTGQECRFFNTDGSQLQVVAPAAQTIRIGSAVSSVAGMAISNTIGDGLWLTYDAITGTWLGITIGNWTVV